MSLSIKALILTSNIIFTSDVFFFSLYSLNNVSLWDVGKFFNICFKIQEDNLDIIQKKRCFAGLASLTAKTCTYVTLFLLRGTLPQNIFILKSGQMFYNNSPQNGWFFCCWKIGLLAISASFWLLKLHVAPCAEQSLHTTLPCAEQSLYCFLPCEEQSMQICSAHGWD